MAQGLYLIVLAQERVSFRIPELRSVFAVFGHCLDKIWDRSFTCGSRHAAAENGQEQETNTYQPENTPYIVLKNVNEGDIRRIMSRTVFAKSAYEVWGHGCDPDAMKKSICDYPLERKLPYYDQGLSFCIRVKAIGRKVSLAEQKAKIDALEDVLPFEGKVDLNAPENEFHLIEDCGLHQGKKLGDPHYVYFGRLVAEGQRKLIQDFSVKKRKFIGNTSMDAGLSFIMSNLAQVKPGDYVCDPFVGTGSLLIAAARFGAYVTGGDINYNILHARGKSSRVGAGHRQKDETIKNSLIQYNLSDKYIDVMVHDAAINPWKTSHHNGIFDAIITDPPYGIRESCRKVGTEKEEVPDLDQFDEHHPEQTAYHLDQVFTDLLNFASGTLVPRGKLVYWIPIYRPEYSEDNLPRHRDLRMLHNCEQVLKRDTSRRLIVMQKVDGNVQSEFTGDEKLTTMFKGHNSFRNKYFKLKQTGDV